MPLSEEELRLLEQMERALVEDDPKLASTLRGTSMRRAARRKVVLAGLVFVVGIIVLMTGAVTQAWYVGVLGFVLMLGAATLGLGAVRSRQSAGTADPRTEHPSGFSVVQGGKKPGRVRKPGRSPRSKAPLMERMEERWRRRRDSGGM